MQHDLFEVPALSKSAKHDGGSLLERYRLSLRLDQCLLGFILLVVGFSLVFCLGVERGRKLVNQASQPAEIILSETAQPKNDLPANPSAAILEVIPEPPTEAPNPDPEPEETPSKGLAPGKYTIQVSTFKQETRANRHLDQLAKHGVDGFIIPSGPFLQVCVKAFETKQLASRALVDLKSQGVAPHDAYVRMIPQ